MAKVRNWFWSHLFAITCTALAILIVLAMNAFGQSVNVGRIGGVLQSGDNVVDTVNHAFKVNIVASGGLTATVSGNLGRSWTLSSGTDSVNVGNFPSSYAVTGAFWQSVQPVSGTFYQAMQPVSGTFYQATQPVSGTFWQATQPVSGSLSILNFPGNQAVTGTFYQATQPVSIASMPSTPVTGTFYQATQPVSIASMPSTPVTGNFYQTTQPVSGTFYQTVQPISGTVITNPAPPPLSAKDMGNPLLYKSAMRVYCQTNLNGCGK